MSPYLGKIRLIFIPFVFDKFARRLVISNFLGDYIELSRGNFGCF